MVLTRRHRNDKQHSEDDGHECGRRTSFQFAHHGKTSIGLLRGDA